MAEVLPGIHTVDGVTLDLAGAEVHVHPVLIVEDGHLTLIDAGPAGSERPIRAYVEGLGYSLRDIERIIVTHHHSDHTGALARLAAETDAAIAAHTAEIPILEGRVAEPAAPLSPEGLRTMGIPITRAQYAARIGAAFDPPAVKVAEELEGGNTLPLLGGLQVLHDTGHSPGHIALLAPARGTLFAADLFAYDGREVLIPLPIFTQDAGQAVQTLRAIVETCDFDAAIPYHGVPLIGHAAEKLRRELSGVKVSVGHPLPGQVLPGG